MIQANNFRAGIFAIALFVASVAGASAQTATFSYNDGVGIPNAGTYTPGSSFTFAINLAFTAGGNISNLAGLWYWFEDRGPTAAAPYNFAITNRDDTGSPFTFLQNPSLSYPQNLTPQNTSDLGGLTASGSEGNGTYFVANLTISIAPTAAPGAYTIENTTSPSGKISSITDSNGHTFAIPQAQYIITVVPEPGVFGLIAIGAAVLAGLALRRSKSLV